MDERIPKGLRRVLPWVPIAMLPLLRILAALLLLAPAPSCERRRIAALQVATNVWPGYEPLYLARQLGMLEPAGVRLVEMPNSTDTLRALRGGMVGAAALTLDEALTLLQDGMDLRIVLVLDISNGADALLGGPGVNSLLELRGRRVGVENNAVGAYLLARALEHAGMRTEELKVVPVTENAHEEALRSAAVDAIVTFEPARSRLIARGAKVLFDSRQLPQEIFDVLVVQAETLRSHPEGVAKLREAWFQALEHLERDPEDATRRMAPREGLEPRSFRRALQGLEFPGRDAERRLREGGLLAPARRLVEVMVRNRLLRRPVDPAQLLAAA